MMELEYPKLEFENICDICGDILSDEKRLSKLSCGHHFHNSCIIESWKKIQRSTDRKCPYCRQHVNLLNKYENEIALKYIHYDKYKYKQAYYGVKKEKCKAIVKTGKNKGLQCKNNQKKGCGDYCKIHYKP